MNKTSILSIWYSKWFSFLTVFPLGKDLDITMMVYNVTKPVTKIRHKKSSQKFHRYTYRRYTYCRYTYRRHLAQSNVCWNLFAKLYFWWGVCNQTYLTEDINILTSLFKHNLTWHQAVFAETYSKNYIFGGAYPIKPNLT